MASVTKCGKLKSHCALLQGEGIESVLWAKRVNKLADVGRLSHNSTVLLARYLCIQRIRYTTFVVNFPVSSVATSELTVVERVLIVIVVEHAEIVHVAASSCSVLSLSGVWRTVSAENSTRAASDVPVWPERAHEQSDLRRERRFT